MNLVFLGSGAFGLPTLQRLAGDHRLLAIVSQPDRPAGRSRKLTPTPIAEWAAANADGVPIHKPEDINEPGIASELRALDADAWVVIAFGQKLSLALIADRFVINLHASLLPRWRGAAPINWAILAGDTRTGNSVITIAQRMDAGLVLAQDPTDIDPLETAGELHDRLAARGPDLIETVLRSYAAGTLTPQTQDESLVTRARKLSKEDAVVDFARPARECRARIHGLNPWPGVGVMFHVEQLRLARAKDESIPPEQAVPPGTILDAGSGLVACAPGSALRLLEVQPAGKRVMPWADFARGRSVRSGECLVGAHAC